MEFKEYGKAPKVISSVELHPSEMCYVQYLPIFMAEKGREIRVPSNLRWCLPLLHHCMAMVQNKRYIYLTSKHYYTNTQGCNRPGWHSDGFMTDDINFIWYDKHPTHFCNQHFWLPQDHNESLILMKLQAREENIVEYPCGSIIMMDEKTIHRVNPSPFEGMRTFVKVSFSDKKYNLKGNAHNYLFDYSWSMADRERHRNHPIVE